MGNLTSDELVTLFESAPDPEALSGLSALPWAVVSDAYGPAKNVPALLRALVSDFVDHREFACLLLHQTIWHQGNIYSATAMAVPFLYRLLDIEGPQDKEAIASLLFNIADGEPSFAECEVDPKKRAFWEPILTASGRSLTAEIAQGRLVKEEVRRALLSKLDLLRLYLNDQSDTSWISFVARVKGPSR